MFREHEARPKGFIATALNWNCRDKGKGNWCYRIVHLKLHFENKGKIFLSATKQCCRTCKAVEILTAKTVEKFTLCRVSRLSACGDDVVNIAFYNLRLVEHDGCQFFCASECSVTSRLAVIQKLLLHFCSLSPR